MNEDECQIYATLFVQFQEWGGTISSPSEQPGCLVGPTYGDVIKYNTHSGSTSTSGWPPVCIESRKFYYILFFQTTKNVD